MKTLALIVACCLFSSTGLADDWTQFLGNSRNGISNETGLIDSWPVDGPKVLWKQPVGGGMSGCAIVGNKLVTMGQDEKEQYAICLNVENGNEEWRTTISLRYENGQGHGPRATPTIADGAVYAFTGDGILARLDLATGKLDWRVDGPAKFEAGVAEYGLSSSPLVANGKVIIQLDAKNNRGDAKLVCLTTDKGETAWISMAADDDNQAGYCSPKLMKSSGKQHVITLTGNYIRLYEFETGRLVQAKRFKTDYACNTATPIVLEDNQVFISAGENHGCALLKIEQTGEKVQFREVWSSFGRDSVMRNEWQTSIRDGDFLYGFDNQGSAGPITNLTCINWKSGERVWKEPRFGKGNMILADGKLWISNMDGQLILAKLDSVKYSELGKKQVTDTTRQAPSLSNGRIFIRGNDSVVCVDVQKTTYEK